MAKFKRTLLKLSGESLMDSQSYEVSPDRLADYAQQIKEMHGMGVQIGIVIGGGSIFKELSGSQKDFDRVKGNQMGMCATVINSLALSFALGAIGIKNKMMTAIHMEPTGEHYSKWKAIKATENGLVCIFSCNTGSPYFTTDTGGSLRGIEIEADVILKGTRVGGVYTAGPGKGPTATKFDGITFDGVYNCHLRVMNLTATTVCKENNLPVYVLNMDIVNNLKKVLEGEPIGTLVHSQTDVRQGSSTKCHTLVVQNVSFPSGELLLCHETYNHFRYMFQFMAAIISKTRNAIIEGRKDDTQQSKLSLLPFRCVGGTQNTI